MTKQAFIQELSSALNPMDSKFRNELLSDISEHFIEGVNQGLSEEEICRNLGQPSSIAEQALEEYKINAHQTQKSYKTYTSYETYKDEKSHSTKNNNNVDIDKTFSNINDIDIEMSHCNIRLVPMPQSNDIRVVLQGKTRHNNFTIKDQGGKLIVHQHTPLIQFVFRFWMSNPSLEATIYIPHNFLGNIKASTSLGTISAQGISGNLKANNAGGCIIVEDYKGNEIKLVSSAGNVKLIVSDSAAPTVKMHSSAGKVTIEAAETKKVKLESSAGNVIANIKKIDGDAKVYSTAGSVSLTAVEVYGNISVTSTAGKVKINMPKDINCQIKAKKPSAGKLINELTGNPDSPYKLHANSTAGSVILSALQMDN